MSDTAPTPTKREPREIQVGPDVIVLIKPNGDFGGLRHRMHVVPRRSELVRVPGAGRPFTRLRLNGFPWIEVWIDAERRIATLRVI